MNDYTDLATAMSVVLERFPSVDAGELEALLDASACTNADGDTVYQPYLIAGWLIRARWQQYERVRSAAGSEVQWASGDAAFKALSDMQAALSHGLSCPAQWQAGATSFEVVF